MKDIFYLFLMLSFGRCSEEQIIKTMTAHVGETITLICTRRDVGTLFWVKLDTEYLPKILGRSFSSTSDDQRIRTATESETFVLHIKKAKEGDTGVYFCMKSVNRDLIFLNGIYLEVKGPDPVFTTAAPTEPVPQEHTVTLQCSVLQDLQNKTCPADGSVFCLSAESLQSHPGLNYARVNDGDEYEKNSEELSTKKCFYSYFRNFSSSDSQTHHCVVATCEELFPGYEIKESTEAVEKSNSKKENTILILLCAALASCLIVIAFLVYLIKKLKKKSYVYSNVENTAAVCLETTVISSGDQENLQTDETTVVYSAPTFKKASKSETRETKPAEEESIYADVKALGLD